MFSCFGPPFCEERDFYKNEFSVGIFHQFSDDRVQSVLNSASLYRIIRSVIILVDSLFPASVVVRVWHHVHIDHTIYRRMTGIVAAFS